jgi:hypothetical protein
MKRRGPFCFILILSLVPVAFSVPKRERASEFLARLSSYKTWKQINRFDDDVSSATFKISNSAIFAGG